MVASLDGSTVVADTSRALSSDVDRDVLLGLREIADLMLVGAGTVRTEGYGAPRKPGQRVGVVSRTGNLDFTSPLFTSGAGFLIMPESAPEVPVDSIRAGANELDLAGALAQLDAHFVQAEGGPALNGALAAADLIDELNLTISPIISGDDGPRLTSGAPPLLHRMDLAHLLEDDGFLFARYLRRR
jgi:riboflavin biosynthesis pyrimidine reductase